MIGSVSNNRFAYYGMQRRPQGERSSGVRSLEEEEQELAATSKSKKKEEEEKLTNPQKLDEDEKEQVEKLKKRDAEVRTHEQAHMAAAGSLAMGGPNYVFQTGPDGRQYAIGGNVKIDTSEGNTPEETARKAQKIKSAAQAPADPSAADLKVVASAASMEVEAASKVADKAEKDSSKSDAAGDSQTNGEITSSRQVFSPSPSDSENDEQDGANSDARPNAYMLQAAKLYQGQQAAVEA